MKTRFVLKLCLSLSLALAGLAWTRPQALARSGDQRQETVQRATVTRTGIVQLPQPASAVFPLFGPIREAEWAEGWEPQVFSPSDHTPHEGMVFTTKHSGEEDTVWILTHLDAARHEITYVAVTPGSRAGIIQIACADAAAGGSRAQATYTFTALGPAGSAYIQGFTEESYARRMAAWEHALGYYLETGRRLRHHE